MVRSRLVVTGAAVLAVCAAGRALRGQVAAPREAAYVGSRACAGCHQAAFEAWRGSRHAAAMALLAARSAMLDPAAPVAPSAAPLGRPADRADGLSVVLDAGEHDETLSVSFVLGVRPIQQLLSPRDGGRLQALPLAFDPVRREWFDVNGDVEMPPSSFAHWSNRGATANAECLYCHTTGYEKGYAPAGDRYESSWAEMGVGCEACHGPGSLHVAAPRSATGIHRNPMSEAMATCAACHSRRVELDGAFVPGEHFADHFDPVLLDTREFHPDGQWADESYEWTGFLTSRMFEEGVTCGDCHDAHDGGLVRRGNALCVGCHDVSYAEVSHTRHQEGPGAECVACHMPETTFMQRDPRRDHSMPLPDPIATEEMGIPNACDACHGSAPAGWAASQVAKLWRGERLAQRRAEARLLHDARLGRPAAAGLVAILHESPNDVRRATAARLLEGLAAEPAVRAALLTAAADPSELVRASAVRALDRVRLAPDVHETLAAAGRDPVKLVRVHAGWTLRDATIHRPDVSTAEAAAAAREAWLEASDHNADSVVGQYNRGIFLEASGREEEAVQAYRTAIDFRPEELWPRQNLGTLLARLGRRDDAEKVFREAWERFPSFAGAPFSLGLLGAEQGRWSDAVGWLQRAVEADASYPRALLNLGLAQVRAGAVGDGLGTLERAARLPDSRADAIAAIVEIARQVGDVRRVDRWAQVDARYDAR